MCLWNAANGPAIHAELVGRAWVKLGHQLTIFSAEKHPDARPTGQSDEDFVIRHFTVEQIAPFTRASAFDASPWLDTEYEIFLAQNVERLPAERLLEHFPRIKEKAMTVQVVHEGKAPEDPLYYRFDWDAIVCFDYRYRDFLVQSFPPEKIHLIPYPYHPLQLGDKRGARAELGLSQDEKIVFSFGFRAREILSVLPALKEIASDYPLRYLVVANPESDVGDLAQARGHYDFIDLQIKPLPLSELYTYLHAADVLLIHRESSTRYPAVVSSSVAQALGSGCPILFHESNFVELSGDEILKYRDLEDMKGKLAEIFEGGFSVDRVKAFLDEHDAERIAQRYLELFEELLIRRRGAKA